VQEDHAIEARRVRCESIEGLQRRDIGLAAEVWLKDVFDSKWASRETMKLAGHLVRYMSVPDVRQVALARIEHQLQLTREEINAALRQMRHYWAIEAFSVSGDELRVALHLTTLQRLRVVEARHRFEFLIRQTAPEPPLAGAKWLPTELHNEAGFVVAEAAG
jgi:hypothetical protein